MSEDTRSKYDIVVEKLQAGGCKKSDLVPSLCTSGSLASYFTTMRQVAKASNLPYCPVIGADGTYVLITWTKWEAQKEASAAKVKPATAKTPEERVADADKRVTRCTNLLEKAKARASENEDNEELSLRHTIAKCNLRLAELEQAAAADFLASQPEIEEEAFDEDEVGEVAIDDSDEVME